MRVCIFICVHDTLKRKEPEEWRVPDVERKNLSHMFLRCLEILTLSTYMHVYTHTHTHTQNEHPHIHLYLHPNTLLTFHSVSSFFCLSILFHLYPPDMFLCVRAFISISF
jgi:hypothetical protein